MVPSESFSFTIQLCDNTKPILSIVSTETSLIPFILNSFVFVGNGTSVNTLSTLSYVPKTIWFIFTRFSTITLYVRRGSIGLSTRPPSV